MIELVVTLALLGITLGIAMPHMPRDAFALLQADRQLLADVRLTRAYALTRGDHFLLAVDSERTYTVHRMTLVGDVWVVSGNAVIDRTLPGEVVFAQGEGAAFEFNTRGLMVTPDAAASLELHDPNSGASRHLTVWPSGQVAPL